MGDADPVPRDPDRAQFAQATRRTFFAEERTLLAWWRTGLASAAVAIALGGIVPRLAHLPRARFVWLGAGYGVLAVFFVVGGLIRARASERAIARGGFAPIPSWVLVGVASYMTVLIVLSVIAYL
jgi:putative membrane protein